MALLPSILEQDLYAALAPYVATVTGLTVGTTVIQGLPNRVSMPPASPGYVTLQFILTDRLNTNIDSYTDAGVSPSPATIETHYSVTCQMDFYGASAFDWAKAVESLWRDPYTVAALAPNCTPLYNGNARFISLDDSEN